MLEGSEVLAVIPARYASTRLPGKPLALIAGKPMIQHVWQRVSAVLPAVVATDDARIAEVVYSFGGRVRMTSVDCPNGTARVAEVLANWEGPRPEIVLNVQGDEPLVQAHDLETLLRNHRFDDAERSRGAALRRQLVAAALTKYNLQAPPWRRPPGARRVVLVPGQVESDASIRHGAPELHTNLALLQAVRAAEPEAWIVYKPHPDVVAGLRQEGSPQADLQHWCDALLTEGCMDQLLKEVDAVHVLTSLAGFEALLRGVEVHTWGLPFFAGWGLSHDRLTCPRRGRQLQLDELVYAALVVYPRYVSRRSGLFIEPEQAIEELLEWSQEPPRAPNWWRRVFRHWGRWRERIAPHTSRSPRL
jgi:hypothetical protein